jgi:hypothetical protein
VYELTEDNVMECNEATDITRARELLTKYEQERGHKQKIRYFVDAFDILDLCIIDEPDSDVGFLAKKIKRTYLIQQLESLPNLNTLDIYNWFVGAILARTPFGRYGEKAEFHGAVIFLISNAASGFVTGVTIPVDGSYLTENI